MRFVSMLIAASVLMFAGASTAPAAVRMVKPEVRLADDGAWQVLIKVWFLDGSWNTGYLRWTGVQGQINWGTAVVCLLQGTGNGYQPEPKWNLLGSRIEILGTAMRSTR